MKHSHYLALAVIMIFGVGFSYAHAEAQTYSQSSGIVTAVHSHVVTVTFPQPMYACMSGAACPDAKQDEQVNLDSVMLLNSSDMIETDVTKVKVGHSLALYYQASGAAFVVKDTTLGQQNSGGVVTVPSSGSLGSTVSGLGVPVALTHNLSFAVQDDQVMRLQQKLLELGYLPSTVTPTGYFGSLTKQAVIKFQSDKGLPTTGYVGPLTRAALNEQ